LGPKNEYVVRTTERTTSVWPKARLHERATPDDRAASAHLVSIRLKAIYSRLIKTPCAQAEMPDFRPVQSSIVSSIKPPPFDWQNSF
jgi:hypothetical protein